MCFDKVCILFDLLQLIKVIVWRGIFCFNFSCLNILWFCNDFWCKNGFGYWSQIRPRYLEVVKKKLPKHKRKNHVFVIAPNLSFPFLPFLFFSLYFSLPLPLCHHHLGMQWWQQWRAPLLPQLPRALNF